MSPSLDIDVSRFLPKRQSRPAGSLGLMALAHVVLDVAEQQGQPSRERQDLFTLSKRQTSIKLASNSPKPRLPFNETLSGGHVGILATEPVGRPHFGESGEERSRLSRLIILGGAIAMDQIFRVTEETPEDESDTEY